MKESAFMQSSSKDEQPSEKGELKKAIQDFVKGDLVKRREKGDGSQEALLQRAEDRIRGLAEAVGAQISEPTTFPEDLEDSWEIRGKLYIPEYEYEKGGVLRLDREGVSALVKIQTYGDFPIDVFRKGKYAGGRNDALIEELADEFLK